MDNIIAANIVINLIAKRKSGKAICLKLGVPASTIYEF